MESTLFCYVRHVTGSASSLIYGKYGAREKYKLTYSKKAKGLIILLPKGIQHEIETQYTYIADILSTFKLNISSQFFCLSNAFMLSMFVTKSVDNSSFYETSFLFDNKAKTGLLLL